MHYSKSMQITKDTSTVVLDMDAQSDQDLEETKDRDVA